MRVMHTMHTEASLLRRFRLSFSLLLLLHLLVLLPVPSSSTPDWMTGVPSEPPPLPAGSEMEELYRLPLYPLPPTPTQSPPPIMPFAVIDWEHQNAFVPPSGAIGISASETEAGFESGWPHDPKLSGAEGETLYKEFEAPPLAKPRLDGDRRVVWVDYLKKRKDSVNPYCDFCAQAFNVMNEKGESASESDMCKMQPEAFKPECEIVAMYLKGHAHLKPLLRGCIDKTGQVGQIKMEKECPGLVACNTIPSEGNSPMCGMRLGGWGDFLPRDGLYENTLQHDAMDISNGFDPPPVVGTHSSPNPYCGLCIDLITELSAKKDGDAATLCKNQPWSLHAECLHIVPMLKANSDVKGILKDGCTDFTAKQDGTEKGAGECSGIVACNAIRGQDSHPMCGGYLFAFSKQKEAKRR